MSVREIMIKCHFLVTLVVSTGQTHNFGNLKCYTVGTPNFVSSYRLQPVVNDSDLLSGRDFAPLTHRNHRVS